jgi:hypothetical protein
MSARLVSFDQKRTELTPGTVLVREWDRRSQRVMVMSDGLMRPLTSMWRASGNLPAVKGA